MKKFLQKLLENDVKINNFSSDKQIINQGLAPLLATSKTSTTIQKANLLEQSKYMRWQEKALDFFQLLNQNNIKFIVFKGFAYSFILYDKCHIRPYSDIDIFIQESDYSKVEKILKDLHYFKMSSRQGKFISFQNSFYDNNNPPTTFDIHWQINNRLEIHQHFQFSTIYTNASKIKDEVFDFKTLSIIDAFILACFHYQAHRPNDRKHIWLYDLALLWYRMNSETQEKCIKIAKQINISQLVKNILIQLQETFPNCLNINLKIEYVNEYSQNYLKQRNKKITDIQFRLQNIKGLNNKIKYLSEYIFQSKNYVKNRYQVKSNFWVYLYYPRMWIEDIFKLFKNQ